MNVLERLVSLYAPHTCLGCCGEGTLLCRACCADLTPPLSICYRCGVGSHGGRTCRSCRLESGLVSANSVTSYDGLAKDLVWRLKFERAQAAADTIGRLMAERFGAALPRDVIVVPVPTATKRVRKRGYDQATLIARAFAKYADLSCQPMLMRLGNQEQIGASKQQRRAQLEGVFRVRRAGIADGLRIVMIDDVLTTGATLEQAAATLRADGAKAVAALVFARA